MDGALDSRVRAQPGVLARGRATIAIQIDLGVFDCVVVAVLQPVQIVRRRGDVLTALARASNCEITFDGLVPQRDGVARLFFTTEDVGAKEVLDKARRLPSIAEVTLLREAKIESIFEATVTGSTLASHVIENGGHVRSLTVTAETTTAVIDQPADHQYTVSIDNVTHELMACACPHHVHRNAVCKHMAAVEHATDDGTLEAFLSEDDEDHAEPENCDCKGLSGFPCWECVKMNRRGIPE